MKNGTYFMHTLVSRLNYFGRLHTAFGLLILSLILGLNSPSASAQSYSEQTLYSFGANSATDGQNPDASLVNVNGTLYGTTRFEGSSGKGTIFAIDPTTHNVNTLYNFGGTKADGGYPTAKLIQMGGKLYGTTLKGGTSNAGTVYSINIDGTGYQVLHTFQGGSADGGNPVADLLDVNGILYGTTEFGGSSNKGTIFAINPASQTELILYSFTGQNGDGSAPSASLINVNGILYGTTCTGGTSNLGTVFSIDPTSNVEKVVYSFGSGYNDGAYLVSSLTEVNGLLYGTTNGGGANSKGTIFAVDPSTHTEKVLYSFGASQSDGYYPETSLINVNGILFGTANEGGAHTSQNDPYGFGTVFSIHPDGTGYQTVYSFTGGTTDGGFSGAGLIDVNGTLYGTTTGDGSEGYGTVFALISTSATTPTAYNDACTINKNTARTNSAPGVLGNDDSGGSGPMTATLVNTTSHGSLTLNCDGSFSYTPNAGFSGIDTFSYRVSNPIGQGTVGTVTLNVVTTPTAHNDGCSILMNTPRTNPAPGVLFNDDNGGSGPMTASLVQTTSHGTLSFHSDGSFTYTPNTGYVGLDTFSYRASNPIGQGTVGTVTLNVITTPTARNDGATISHNTSRTFAAPGVLSNDNSGGASPMIATLVSSVTHGTLTLHSDGSFVYSPNAGYSGTDTFTYRAVNAIGQSNIATVTLTVQ